MPTLQGFHKACGSLARHCTVLPALAMKIGPYKAVFKFETYVSRVHDSRGESCCGKRSGFRWKVMEDQGSGA